MTGLTEPDQATSQNPVMNDQIPTSPSAPQQVPRLLAQVDAHGEAFIHDDPEARMKLLEAARSLVYALETPREAMIRYCWSQVGFSVTCVLTMADRAVDDLCGHRDWRGYQPLPRTIAG